MLPNPLNLNSLPTVDPALDPALLRERLDKEFLRLEIDLRSLALRAKIPPNPGVLVGVDEVFESSLPVISSLMSFCAEGVKGALSSFAKVWSGNGSKALSGALEKARFPLKLAGKGVFGIILLLLLPLLAVLDAIEGVGFGLAGVA